MIKTEPVIMTANQEVFILNNRMEMTIKELSKQTGLTAGKIYRYIYKRDLDFKRDEKPKKGS